MQDLDSKTWDSRNWNNWLTLFVHDKCVAGTMAPQAVAQTQLDVTELVDFI